MITPRFWAALTGWVKQQAIMQELYSTTFL
jgi:hypothetical protein